MCGRRGMGALAFQFLSADAARAWIHAYYHAYTKHLDKLCEYETNPNIAVVSGFTCAPTDAEAERIAEGWTFFRFALLFYNRHGPVKPGSINLWDEYEVWRRTEEGQKMRSGGLIGSPETLRVKLRKFEASHVDQVILLNQTGRTSHEDICSSLELFAREVMPEFQERDGEHQAWKQGVLDGDIELEPIDTGSHAVRSLQTPTSRPQSA